MDIKCPMKFADVLMFDRLESGDFDALLAWDKGYAWQIMMQAKCAGTKAAWLIYFTDRLPMTRITDEERQEVQLIIDYMGERMSEENAFPKTYTFATNGFHYAAKRYELTEEISQRIDKVLAAAEEEVIAMMHT